MQQLRTEYPFTLPKGYLDADGVLHREGMMRLATARDELEPLNDPKVANADDPYLTVIVLARVITRLGSLTRLSPRDVEGLFAADLAHLQDVYAIINYGSEADIQRLLAGAGSPAAPLAASRPAGGSGPAATPGVPDAGPAGAGQAFSGEDEGAAGASPVSAAARSMVGGTRAPAGPVGDPEVAPAPTRGSRRGRIEEVGRSTGGPA